MSLYFKTHNNGVVKSNDIVQAALVVDNKHINVNDNTAVREYALTCCSGVDEEIIDVTVESVLKAGGYYQAIHLYYETNRGSTLKDAKMAVDAMQLDIFREELNK
jgi:hypothetical protein